MGLFDRSLDDLIRNLRNMTGNDLCYIAQCIDKIRIELRKESMAVKANAVTKLLYLQMHGWENSWAAFHIIEVMSSVKFTFKRTGYLVASQSFHKGLEILVLSTNTIRRDINSQNLYEAGIAMNALSNFVTPNTAEYLSSDILTLSNSVKPYLRKRATLLLYHISHHFPKVTDQILPRLVERLEDQDPGVQLTAVNVIYELARDDPQKYLPLTPKMLNIMKNAPNNWMLIKIIKLFCMLVPVDSRLDKKFMGCILSLIHSTTAMSLLYECLNTALVCMNDRPAYINLSKLCVEKLRFFIQSSDKNLKYLGLLTMSRVLKSHQNSFEVHRDLVLECLEDRDHSIKHRALDLLQNMVSKKNLRYVVEKLIVHMENSPGVCYRDLVIAKVIEICSQNNYIHMNKFEWYICVLIDLTKMKNTKKGHLISDQLIDICLRFEHVRSFVVSKMTMLVENGDFLYRTSDRTNINEVLRSAFWICGEHAEMLKKPQRTLEIILNSPLTDLPPKIQMLCVQSIYKIYACVVGEIENSDDFELVKNVSKTVSKKLKIFDHSDDLEVQERINCIKNVVKLAVKYHSKKVKVADDLHYFREEKLVPVEQETQERVPVPADLDLGRRINELIQEHVSDQDHEGEKSYVLTKRNKLQKKLTEKKKRKKKTKKTRERCPSTKCTSEHRHLKTTQSLLMFGHSCMVHEENGSGEKAERPEVLNSFI